MTRPNLATTGTRLAADRAPSTCYGAASYPSVQSPIKRHRENGSRVGSQHEGAPGRHPNRHTPRHLESPVTMPPAAAQPRRIWTALPNLRSEQRTDSAPRRLLWLTAIVEYYQRPKCSRSPECNNTTLGQRLKRAMKTTRVTVCCLKCLGCRHTRMSTKAITWGSETHAMFTAVPPLRQGRAVAGCVGRRSRPHGPHFACRPRHRGGRWCRRDGR